jgi:chorismate lyase/3-hydroxybenzoate synthase
MTQPEVATRAPESATPRIEYRELAPGGALPADVLCAVVFGSAYSRHGDPRCVRVGLNPLKGAGIAELWRATGPVHIGFDAPIRYAADPAHLAGAIELDERDFGGLASTAEAAYAALRRFQAQSPYPSLLRVWNYFDGINRGEGDTERYKQFCLGRAAGLEVQSGARLPAATAIGRRDGNPVLQVYWLAGRVPGVALENPRQTSAYRYPRQYGPSPPSFSRAMLVERRLLMISGTASILGHVSRHPGDLVAQIDETLTNLASVQQRAAALAPGLAASLGAQSLLKIYLRDAAAAELVDALIGKRLPAGSQYMILEADICRSELLVEIDCLHGAE